MAEETLFELALNTPDADRAACPTLSVHAFSAAVLDALRRRVGEANADDSTQYFRVSECKLKIQRAGL